MKIFSESILITLALLIQSIAAPLGICLHAYSPQAPVDQIEAFEFTKVEKIANGYRFFHEPRGSTVVTDYRYRGVILYKPNLAPSHPDFEKTLKLYEETSTATPSTRRFLNPRILEMQQILAATKTSELSQNSLPSIQIDGQTYLDPSFRNIDEGKMTLKHTDGFAKIDLDRITKYDLELLVNIDKSAAAIKVLQIANRRLWNPEFSGLVDGNIKIKHEKGVLSLPLETTSDSDKQEILSWSDGTWKLALPGIYLLDAANSLYELVVADGKFLERARLSHRNKENIVFVADKKELQYSIKEVYLSKSISAKDLGRVEEWLSEILDERFASARPATKTETLSFVKADTDRITSVRASVLQVFAEGILADGFVGRIHTGASTIKTTVTVTTNHPVTGDPLTRIIDTKITTSDTYEDVSEDLCYIVLNTSILTENQIIRADSMKRSGRHQYIDAAGRPRTVRKYNIE